MPGVRPRWTTAVVLALALVCGPPVPIAEGQGSPPGRIVGRIDGGGWDDGRFHIWGWACQQGRAESLAVHVYGQTPGAAREAFVLAGKANLDNEPAVDRACQDTRGRKHRFDVTLPNAMLVDFHGRLLVIHGIRAAGAVENSAISGSGAIQIPDGPPLRTIPRSYPSLTGTYASRADHPRVFVTHDELKDTAARINTAGSFSARRFAALAETVQRALAANVDWDAAYSGCDMEIYLRGFSFEPKPAYGNDRSEEALGAAMKVRRGAAPLHGGAVVASRLALYAALAKAGAAIPSGAPTPDEAAAIARRILLAWAERGFRDENGRFRRVESQYCDLDPKGKQVVTQFGKFVGALTLSRGVVYSAHAQDLLQGIEGFWNPQEETQLNTFHREMYDAIRRIHNEEFEANMKWKYSDEVYNNQFTSHLTSLLAVARLLDDRTKVQAVLYGGEGDGAVTLPWVSLFDHVIYGNSDRPLLRITPNSTEDPRQSHPAYTTNVVAPGEINDRYRNDNPAQGIGYAMGTLQWLFMAAEALEIAGFDAYGYRGPRGQSLEMAAGYYACYARSAGFRQTITAENSGSCPNVRQYVGKIVNGVDANLVIAAWRFPNDKAISELEEAAKTSSSTGPFSLDAVLFGKWRD